MTKAQAKKVAKVVQVKVTRVRLKPNDTLFVVFKSDEIDAATVQAFRDQLRPNFPNNKVAIIAMSTEDDVRFTTIEPGKAGDV